MGQHCWLARVQIIIYPHCSTGLCVNVVSVTVTCTQSICPLMMCPKPCPLRVSFLLSSLMNQLINAFSQWQSDMADKREVPSGEGELLARQLKCPFFETSAKLRSNVEECFHELVRQIKRLQQESTKDKPERPSGGGCCVLL